MPKWNKIIETRMTSYRNKNLTNELTETSTVFLDPYMPHFSEQEVSFSWFTLTGRIGNSELNDFKLKSVVPDLTVLDIWEIWNNMLIKKRYSCWIKEVNNIPKSLVQILML